MRLIYSLYNLHYPIKCQFTIIIEKVLHKWKSSSTLNKHGAQWMPICNKTELKLHPIAYVLISACVQNENMCMDCIFMRQICNQVQEGKVSTLFTTCKSSKEQGCHLLKQVNALKSMMDRQNWLTGHETDPYVLACNQVWNSKSVLMQTNKNTDSLNFKKQYILFLTCHKTKDILQLCLVCCYLT